MRLQLQSGHKVTLKVSTIDADALFSTEGQRVPLSEVAIVERRLPASKILAGYTIAAVPIGLLAFWLTRDEPFGCVPLCI